jgi:hypothetical protein
MKYLVGLVTILVIGAVAPAVSAASLYTITDLGTLGGTNSYGQGINANGEVAGYSALSGNADECHIFKRRTGAEAQVRWNKAADRSRPTRDQPYRILPPPTSLFGDRPPRWGP